MEKLIFALLLTSLLNTIAVCQPKKEPKAEAPEIVITKVEFKETERGKQAIIEINGAMKIKEIDVTEKAGKTIIKFPTYVSRSGREYPQVKILSKAVHDKIVKAIEEGKVVPPEKVPPLKYKITKFFPLRARVRKANAEVTFNEAITIVIGVMESRKEKGEYWIAWPSRRDEEFGRWIRQVTFRDKKFKEEIEEEIIKKYKRFLTEVGEEEEY